MNPLKLKHFFIENIRCEFPKFPAQIKNTKVLEKLTADITIYLNKSDDNSFAIKLKVTFSATKKDTKRIHFLFAAIMVGIFKRLEEKKPIKELAKTIGKEMLYEKMYVHFSDILNCAPLTNIQLPTKIGKK